MQKIEKLSGRQLRYLKSLGHHLKPLVILGREGINESVIKTVNEVLTAHELVKIRVGNSCPLDRQEAAAVITADTGAYVIQILGKIILVYRENPDRREKHRIKLPH